MDRGQRIAIYGGTFDPVHLGHLQIATRVSGIFAIDQFLFVPARLAPHKIDREVTSGFHRHAMLTLATQHDDRVCVSTFELERGERQYTVDTLAHFRGRYPDCDLFFVMGADSWAEITTWRDWQRLRLLANLIVVTRPGYDVSKNAGDLQSAVVDVRGRSEEAASLSERPSGKVFITDAVQMNISATDIRQAAGQAKELGELVPLAVAEYIEKYGLYRNKHEAKLEH
jgi:nicotinate-nucleotide adenylyltransferase